MDSICTKKPLWYSFCAFGGAAIAAALAALTVCLIRQSVKVVPLLVLLAILAGGVLLVLLCIKTIKTLPDVIAEAKPKRSLPQKNQPSHGSLCLSRCIAIIILILCGVFFLIFYSKAQETQSIPQSTVQSGIQYEKGKVLAITGGTYQGQQDMEDVPVGKQILRVQITSGEHKGEILSDVTNNLSYLYGTLLEVGDSVTISYSYTNGVLDDIQLQDYDRTVPLLIVLALFLIITILIGGKIGAKSLLGLALTILCIFTVLIPLLLGGAPTLLTVFATCALVTIVEFMILDGFHRKTVCAILGTLAGVLLAMLFAQLSCSLMRIDGYKMYTAEPTIEALLQIRQGQEPSAALQIGDLLVGGILIAALGAVNDVAMSISSAMNELIAVNPNLTRKELFKSGMNIGRDMVGTMTNTLILALAGSSFVLMIYLSSLEPSFAQLMSSTFFSVEMVQALSSSIGVILAVPFSVLIGMLLFGHTKKTAKKVK